MIPILFEYVGKAQYSNYHVPLFSYTSELCEMGNLLIQCNLMMRVFMEEHDSVIQLQ